MKRFFVSMAALLSLAICMTAQERRWAVVGLSAIYMRQAADYESALETQELMGTVVEIVGENGYWREIVSPQPYRAWCTEKGLVEMSRAEAEAYAAAPKCMFISLYGHVYEGPSCSSSTICDLVGGDVMRTTGGCKGQWVGIMLPSGREGWVRKRDVRGLEQWEWKAFLKGDASMRNGDRVGWSILNGNTGNGTLTDRTAEGDGQDEKAVLQAVRLLGVPYLWGGMTAKGVDCSGLVRLSYLMEGVMLPRNASQQIFCGRNVDMPVDISFWDESRRIADGSAGFRPEFRDEMLKRIGGLKRGDLVFFGTPAQGGKGRRVTHVGIYIGDGRIIHASHMVRINSLVPGDEDYYENAHRLLAACRL